MYFLDAIVSPVPNPSLKNCTLDSHSALLPPGGQMNLKDAIDMLKNYCFG